MASATGDTASAHTAPDVTYSAATIALPLTANVWPAAIAHATLDAVSQSTAVEAQAGFAALDHFLADPTPTVSVDTADADPALYDHVTFDVVAG